MSTKVIGGKKTVIAFPDEEQFVVPKRGGFGTPNSKYLNVAAQGTPTDTLPPDITKTGNLGDEPTPPNVLPPAPPITPEGIRTVLAPPLPTVSEVQAYNCDKLSIVMAELQSNSSIYLGSGDAVLITQYNQIFELVNSLMQQKCTAPKPIAQSDPTYSYPTWSSLNCEQAKSETDKLRSFINSTNWLDPANREKALLQLETGLEAMTKACTVTPAPIGTIVGGITEPVVPVVPISQLTSTMAKFGSPLGGGGGGGGATSSTATTVKKSDDWWWIWLLIGGGALYLATRKKKNK